MFIESAPSLAVPALESPGARIDSSLPARESPGATKVSRPARESPGEIKDPCPLDSLGAT